MLLKYMAQNEYFCGLIRLKNVKNNNLRSADYR
jgi:hypothetical protein